MAGNNTRAIAPKEDKLATLKGLFEKSKPSLAAVLPRHMTPERILKIALSAASRTPLLLQCTPQSILLAVMQCAQLGLEPNTPLGLAYLVPYKNNKKDVDGRWNSVYEAQFIPGYRGLIKLAHQSGDVVTIRSRVVRDGDHFEVELGSDERLVHRPNLSLGEDEELRPMVAVYAVAVFKSGATQFEVMSKAQIDSLRKRSKASEGGPWSTDYEEMARKTVLRRLCKSLPLSTELASALDAQARAESGEVPDYGEIAEVIPSAPELASGQRAPSATDVMKQQLRAATPVAAQREPGDDGDDEPPPFPTGTDGGPRGSNDVDAQGGAAEGSAGAGAQAMARPLEELRAHLAGKPRGGGGTAELAEIVASWSKRRAALIDEGLGDEAFDVVREELRSRGCGDPDRFIAGVQGRTKRTVNG